MLTFSTSTVLLLISVLTGVLTARLLGPTGKGQLTAIVIWPAILSLIGTLGLPESINYFTANNENLRGKILASGVYLGIVQAIALIGIGWLLTPLVLGHQGEELILLGRYYLFFIPLNLFTLYHQSYLAGRLWFGVYNLVRLTVAGTILGGLLLLTLSGRASVQNVLIVYLAGNAVTLLLAVVSVYISGIEGFIPDRSLARTMLVFGLKTQASSVTVMVNERLDQLLIAVFMPSQQLGYYAVAVSLTTGVIIIGTSMAMVAMPVVAKTATRAEQIRSISRFFRVNLWMSILVAACFMVVIHYLILLLFGDEYLPAEMAARILLLAAVPLSANRVLQASLKAVNLPLQAGWAELIAAILTVTLLLFLLPAYGIAGAAVTSLLAYSVSFVYMIWIIYFKIGCSLGELFIPRMADYKYALRLINTRLS